MPYFFQTLSTVSLGKAFASFSETKSEFQRKGLSIFAKKELKANADSCSVAKNRQTEPML